MEISTSYNSASVSLINQAVSANISTSANPAQGLPHRDSVDVSDEALKSSRMLGRSPVDANGPMLKFLGDALSLASGRDVQEVTAGFQGASVSTDSVSLSQIGAITTKDGKSISFTLDLQYDQAKLTAQSGMIQAGPAGLSLSYQGSAAELSSTNFSFTMGADGESGPVTGRGSLQLNDEVSRVGKELKPMAKEFMQASGLRGGWGTINRFMRSIS